MIKLFSYENEVPVTIRFTERTDYLGALPDEVSGSHSNSINYYTVDGAGINLSAPLKFYDRWDFRGYTPTEPSDEEGQISGLLIFNFNTVPHATNVPLSLIFADDSCVLASVEMLAGDGQRIAFYDNMPIEDGVLSCVIEDARVAQVSIRFIKTNVPHQRVKINSIWFGQVQCYSKFKDNSLLEEINILSTDLPGNSFSASIVYNENIGLSNDKPVYLYNDGIFYGKYYVGDVRRTQENIYSITCYSNIEKLDSFNFDNYWANWYDRDYENSVEPRRLNYLFDVINYYSSVGINNEITLPSGTYFDLMYQFMEDGKTFRYWLCAAAHALNGWVKSARVDTLRIKSIPTTVTSTIGNDRIIGQAILDRRNIITKCNWEHTVWHGFQGATDTLESNSQRELTGDYISSVQNIDGGAFITARIRKTGHKYEVRNSSAGEFYYSYLPPYTAPIVSINNTKEPDAVENIIEINEPKMCLMRATRPEGTYYLYKYFDEDLRKEQLKKFIESRGTVRAKIIAKDEQVGDLVTIQTAWDGEVTGIITKMNTHFSNYGTTAEIEVYEWDV